jgi:hypothetical protein
VAPDFWSPAQVQELLMNAASVEEALDRFREREAVRLLRAA